MSRAVEAEVAEAEDAAAIGDNDGVHIFGRPIVHHGRLHVVGRGREPVWVWVWVRVESRARVSPKAGISTMGTV